MSKAEKTRKAYRKREQEARDFVQKQIDKPTSERRVSFVRKREAK